MKNLFSGILIITIIFATYSCGQHQNQGAIQDTPESQLPPIPEKSQEPDQINVTERKLIKEGDISFETPDIQKTKSSIAQAVQGFHGYIFEDNIFSYSSRLEQRIVVRVPSEKFDSLIQKITEGVDNIESKSIRTLDVTEEFIDIESRIKTKKELQERYRDLLKKANTVNEMLSLEKEIGELQTDIESVEGRMKYLNDRISLSTLTVTFYQKTSSSFGFGSRFVQAISEGWNGFLNFVIGIAYLWVFAIIGFIIVYWLYRKKKRKNPAK